MFRIDGALKDYPWGVTGGLRSWLPDPSEGAAGPEAEATAGPEAELWFGAHPSGSSPLADHRGRSLGEVTDPADVPLLVKLLAAARPLSIQVHPPAELAATRFAAQEGDSGSSRLLADSRAKDEMLIALKPFSALQGLRDPELASSILTRLGGAAAEAAELLRAGDPKAAIRRLLSSDPTALAEAGDKVASTAAAAGLPTSDVQALAAVSRSYPGDPGVVVAAMLEHRSLLPGEAIYLPAGVVHAYVSGTGVEVMTASDNVLRLGLTGKTVATEAALEAMRPELRPEPLRPSPVELADGGTVRHYRPEGAPFSVAWLTGGSETFSSPVYRLVLATSGQVVVRDGCDAELRLRPGQAAAVLASDGAVNVSAGGSAFISEAQALS